MVEARHKPITRVLASYVAGNPETWVRWVPLAQWLMRATPRKDRNDRSPYEMITGLRPQGPLEAVFRKLGPAARMDASTYVHELQKNLASTHASIARVMEGDLERKRAKEAREEGGSMLKVGTYVVLRVPPRLGKEERVSARLQPKAYPLIYQIHKMISPQAVILKDPDSGSTELGFAQPVAVERLRVYDLNELEEPMNPEEVLTLELLDGGVWKKATLVSQSATGAVTLEFEDGSKNVYDLQREEYRWTT